MKKTSLLVILAASWLLEMPAEAHIGGTAGGQNQAASAPPNVLAKSATSVSRTTKAKNYRRAGGSTKVYFQGTELMPRAAGDAKVESKSTRIEIDAKFGNMEDATKFGFEYLTYVLWAISPQGRAVNLGEVVLKNGSGQVRAITDMQTFGMVITAEPYFAVTQPGDVVVLENSFGAATTGKVESIGATYELLERGVYSSSNTKIENAIFGIDRKTPLQLFEARNAVRIARVAGADRYASATIAKAEQQLKSSEAVYRQNRDRKAVEAAARETVETAEEARVMAVQKKAEEEAQAKAAAEKRAGEEREAKARADAAAEVQRRQQAEQARAQAEAAQAEAERMKLEADKAAQEAARQKQEAEQARAAALTQQKAAQAVAEQAARDKDAALAQQRVAEAQAEKARQTAEQAEAEKTELRARLLNQLNTILQTRDSARGLIINMSDVLFDTGSYTLKPGAREKLAKISGIVLAHSGLSLAIEGHTDSVGSDEFNQQLSERRADSVRDFLALQGVPASAITARGFGKTQPVTSNDTAEGRQRNRRVELVVNGEAIGSAAATSSRR
ncbi:MAG TPA: OmpA family protein [Candidatus Dormibacteraeota bacterium]|nr:OmpA family protein [Candidatus Dormibacteraeota bacterium]